MAKRNQVRKIIDSKHLGLEPKLTAVKSRKDTPFMEALNWYSSMNDHRDAKKYLIDWMKGNGYTANEVAALRNIKDCWMPTTAAWIARMNTNGTFIGTDIISIVRKRIDETIVKYATETEEDLAVKAKTEDDAAKSRAQKMIDALFEQAESLVDEWMNGGQVSFYDFLKKHDVSKQNANMLHDFYAPILADLNTGDSQLKEAYGRKLKATIAFYQGIVDDCQRYVGNKKKAAAPRKPRVKKAVPVSKLVSNVKYQKEDPALKLQSVSPENLIGAKQVWLYNTKYRKLTVVNSEAGLGVKGTTLTGFDETTSVGKTLRKPEQQLAQVLTLARVPLKKFFAEIRSTEGNFNGRINENTVILKALK